MSISVEYDEKYPYQSFQDELRDRVWSERPSDDPDLTGNGGLGRILTLVPFQYHQDTWDHAGPNKNGTGFQISTGVL
jgi:hypothetical protein